VLALRVLRTDICLMRSETPASAEGPKLLTRMRRAMRSAHYSPRTEAAYMVWVRRYVRFHGLRHPVELGEREVAQYLTHLAVERRVSASTQQQAMSALLLLYKEVLGRPLGALGVVRRAHAPARLPVVLARSEVQRVLARLDGVYRAIGMLLYGSGLRLQECLELRVKDLDFERGEITVRRGKGAKDRVTVFPERARGMLAAHLEEVKLRHEEDVRRGQGRVVLPGALARKLPQAARDWAWQWVFPAGRQRGGEQRRAPPASHSRDDGAAGDGERDPGGGTEQAGELSHVPAFVRDASAGGGVRHPDGARAIGTPGCEHHDDLHACAQPGRTRRRESGRLSGRRGDAWPPDDSGVSRAELIMRAGAAAERYIGGRFAG
jgi:integron integrase